MARPIFRPVFAALALALAAGCTAGSDAIQQVDDSTEGDAVSFALKLGAVLDTSKGQVTFRVFSAHATRMEVAVFANPSGEGEAARFQLAQDPNTDVWSTTVKLSDLSAAGVGSTIYYGYRAWGPNWGFDASWTPGSSAGFVADVDAAGNRFNPNKLLLDPYAVEMSHDPMTPGNLDGSVYGTGAQHRAQDSGPVAPKGIVLALSPTGYGTKPTRALKDDVIYEVHVRGLTMSDPSVDASIRGTYAGAAKKAAYLQSIGVTAIEFLPVQETQNDTNDVDPTSDAGDNYWGYMTLDYFAPERRYAADKSPGGPTREFKAMVKAFHDRGIKVFADVVFNHTGEGGLWDSTGNVAGLYSMRGLDNATYYELSGDKRFYYDNTGCGANFNTAGDIPRALVIDSLGYWKNVMGLDGFRFDLASVLGNTCESGCFDFNKMDPQNAMNRAVSELPVRPAGGGSGVDLIAEPWAIGGNSYQVGGFPAGWAEWNGVYRDTFRKAQNKLGSASITPGDLATRFAGSSDLYQDDGRKPWHSINFLVAHDGFTLRDLYAYSGKTNGGSWPYGPSDGGEDNNNSWDQGGDPALQRQAARTGLAILMLSAGVPMITGGDEIYRTQYGNNNAYNLDSDKNWLDWSSATPTFAAFSRRMMQFRGAHPALRRAEFFTGQDHDGNGLKDITWLTDGGWEADGGYMTNANNHFLAFRIDGQEAGDSFRSIYVAYNGWSGKVTAHLPQSNGWYRVADTAAWNEPNGNMVEAGQEQLMSGGTYDVAARSILVLVER